VATTDPWPSAAELDAAYAGAYRPASGRFGRSGDALLRRTRGSLAGRIDRIAPAGTVLDVGAGDGALAEALRARGRAAVESERPQGAADLAAEVPEPPPGGWAGIVFWHSLEHLTEPAAALARAAAALAPGGVVVIAVPNSASLQAALFGERWLALDPPRHLVHLSATALVSRLAELGLAVERISHLRGGQVFFGWLDGLVGAVPGHPSLYDAVRSPRARFHPVSRRRRASTLAAAALLAPLALLGSAVEVAARRGGSVYVEARSR
jgi:SAM-dependent methyltransferase